MRSIFLVSTIVFFTLIGCGGSSGSTQSKRESSTNNDISNTPTQTLTNSSSQSSQAQNATAKKDEINASTDHNIASTKKQQTPSLPKSETKDQMPKSSKPSSSTKKLTKEHYTQKGSIVIDNQTGLKWQDSGIKWGDFDEAKEICKDLVLDGESGWRVPTQRELLTLLDLAHNPKIDPIFSTKASEEFWSSTPYMADPQHYAYYVDFSTGWSYMYSDRDMFDKSKRRAIRCVKGDKLPKDHFVKKSKTIIDTTTNLMWQNDPSLKNNIMSVDDAKAYCQNLKLAGFDDWRLPTISELLSIADRSHYDPAIDERFDYLPTFGKNEKDFTEGNYWSSSYYGVNRDNPSIHYYRTLNIQNGASHRCRSYMGMYVRCVRDVK